jgi:heme/copper-type cytochrome/quinol oxidase subunit 2
VEIFIIATIVVVLVGVSVLLVAALVKSVRSERGARKIWKNFALSIAFCILFFVSWLAQGIAEWGVYRAEQKQHHETPTISGFVVQFGQSTLENWQSEFLQLFSFVVLSALLIHKGSAESKDSDEEMQATLKRIEKRLDEMEKVRS